MPTTIIVARIFTANGMKGSIARLMNLPYLPRSVDVEIGKWDMYPFQFESLMMEFPKMLPVTVNRIHVLQSMSRKAYVSFRLAFEREDAMEFIPHVMLNENTDIMELVHELTGKHDRDLMHGFMTIRERFNPLLYGIDIDVWDRGFWERFGQMLWEGS